MARFTQALNDRFSPEIHWEAHVHAFQNRRFALLYFSEATSKPVVCIRNGTSLKEGDIYYRYRGQSQRIKYPELRALLDMQAIRERNLWIQYLQKMAKVGIENIAVLDTVSGQLSSRGNTFLIPEALLPKLNFVKSGFFTEDEAGPALRLLGDASVSSAAVLQTELKVPSSLGEIDIVRTFLEGSKVISPLEFIRRICNEKSSNLPVYFFIDQLEISKEDIISDLNNMVVRGQVKDRLIQRLAEEELPTQYRMGPANGASKAATERVAILERIGRKEIGLEDLATNVVRFCEALTHIRQEDSLQTYVLGRVHTSEGLPR